MARRNFDTEYFRKPFVRGLSGVHKLFYVYVISDADHAGIWTPDFEIAELLMGMKLDKEGVLKAFGNRIIQLNDGKWFFPEIIKKQYPNGLSGNNNAVESARKKLNKYHINLSELEEYISGVRQGLTTPRATHIDIENEVESEYENETELENEEPAEIRHFKQPVETVPYQEVVDYFHNACPELPKVTKLTDARKTHIRARLKDHGNEAMAEVFQKAGASHFLNGNNDRQFQANFDWLLNPNNFIKTLEGNYDNKERNSTSGKQGAISEELKREILASDFLKNA